METFQLEEVTFDIFKTLKVIENNPTLDKFFRKERDISYNLLFTMAKQNSLDSDLLDRAKEIFDVVISKNQAPLEEYLKITVSDETDEKTKKPSKYYGKKRIMEDIKSNNTTSELDRAMLSLNTLRNIYSKLRGRGIKDKTKGTQILSDADCRDIVAAVRIVENKVANILKKK